jgi:hypothetical protein
MQKTSLRFAMLQRYEETATTRQRTEIERERREEHKEEKRNSRNSNPLALLRLVRKAPRRTTIDNNRRILRRHLPEVEIRDLRELVDSSKEGEGAGGLGVNGLRDRVKG